MTRNRLYRPLLAAVALPLALAACGGSDEGGAPKGDAIAAIPAPAGQTWNDVASETPEGGIQVGNPDAPIKLVEYASAQLLALRRILRKERGRAARQFRRQRPGQLRGALLHAERA